MAALYENACNLDNQGRRVELIPAIHSSGFLGCPSLGIQGKINLSDLIEYFSLLYRRNS